MILQIPKKDSIIFPYIPYNNKLKPIANIKFEYVGGKSLSLLALIDSGADRSCSFVEIGERLGIDFEDFDKEKNVAYGIKGDGIPGYKAPIKYTIGGHEIYEEVTWLDTKFNPQTSYLFILGRIKIFNEFDVVFQEHMKRIIFRKV